MKKTVIAAAMMCLLALAGCVGGDVADFSRYPSVAIPGYGLEEYYTLLFDKRPDIVYNAVCNLIEEAPAIGRHINGYHKTGGPDKNDVNANIYNQILGLLSSRNSKIQAASLRFLQRMSSSCSWKQELIAPVLAVKSNNTAVQSEQVATLIEITTKDSKIDRRSLNKFLHNRNWLVSRQAYLLVNNLEDEPSRMELIQKYSATGVEFEKLLILSALKNNFSDAVFVFLTHEIASAKNPKIRHTVFDLLGSAQNTPAVLSWIDSHYGLFSTEDTHYLADAYTQRLPYAFSSSLMYTLISHGFTPDAGFYKKFNEELVKVKSTDLERLDALLLSSASLKDTWLSFKGKEAPHKQVDTSMQKEYDAAVDSFSARTDEILKKYKADDEARKQFISEIASLKDSLGDELGR